MSPFLTARRSFARLASLMAVPSGLMLALVLPLHAQTAAPAATPDVIVFANGDQLTGKLVREVAGSVTFHSDVVGDVTVTWDKIKSIHTAQQFAVIEQGQHVNRKTPEADVAKGNIQVESDQVQVTPPGGSTSKDIPTKNAEYVIDQATYTKELRGNPGFFSGWSGGLTAGASLVEATQNSRNFTGSAALVRTIPSVTWLDPRNRTSVDLTAGLWIGGTTRRDHFEVEYRARRR